MKVIKNFKTMKVDKWYTTVHYIDEATGHELTKKEAQEEYTTINKIKNSTYEHIENNKGQVYTKGHLEITNICRKKARQGNLFN